MHNHFIPSYRFSSDIALYPKYNEKSRDWTLTITGTNQDRRTIEQMDYPGVIVWIACHILLEDHADMQACTDLAHEICQSMEENPSILGTDRLVYKNCHIDLYCGPDGSFEVMFEPGVGTMKGDIRHLTSHAAYSVIYNMLMMLRNGYLVCS